MPAPFDDFMSDDFIVSDDVLPLVDDDVPLLVSVPVADGELPVPPPDFEPVPDEVCACASAGAAASARATTSAIAPVDVFIALPPACCGCFRTIARARPQLAWRRSATDLRKSCATGGASTRATLGSVTGRPSRAER